MLKPQIARHRVSTLWVCRTPSAGGLWPEIRGIGRSPAEAYHRWALRRDYYAGAQVDLYEPTAWPGAVAADLPGPFAAAVKSVIRRWVR